MLLRAELFSALALPIGLGLIVNGSSTQLPSPAAPVPQEAPAVSFSEQILPIFTARCGECHGEQNTELGLNLATYEAAMQGSDYGTVIEAGNPDGSLLIDMIISGDMPEDGDPVPEEEIELIRQWIAEGALNN